MSEKRNPFFNMGTIEDSCYFANRDEELRKLLRFVSNQTSCSIVGSRKIGKSSLVKHAMRVVESSGSSDESLQRRLWVYLDFQQLTSFTKSGFWKLLLRELVTRLTELPEEYRRDIDLDRESLLQQWDEILAVELGTKLRQLALTSKGIKPVIVMDEFESTIDNPHLDYGFYGALRSFNSELTYVTVTQSPLHRLRYRSPSTITSPFFNIFVEIPVELFSPENARKLLLKLSSLGETPFLPGDIEFLIGLAGCHPFFLQRAGYYLFELRSGDGSRAERNEMYRDVERSFYQEACSHFQYFWDGLDDEQKTALKRASEGDSFTKDSLAKLERIALVGLAEQSFVCESKEGYQVFSRAFGQFIRNQT